MPLVARPVSFLRVLRARRSALKEPVVNRLAMGLGHGQPHHVAERVDLKRDQVLSEVQQLGNPLDVPGDGQQPWRIALDYYALDVERASRSPASRISRRRFFA
jgi:hypothetical protein